MFHAIVWFVVGFLLIMAEFAVPGVILVFIGLGAWTASLTTWAGWTPEPSSQMAVFAIASLLLLVSLRRLFKDWFLGFSQNASTAGDLDEFHGRQVRVLSTVGPNETGKVEFKGVPWNASSEETLQPGDLARIDAMDGLCLKVRRS
jgi:membrane protein implicated in regulation of membrane protease activity